MCALAEGALASSLTVHPIKKLRVQRVLEVLRRTREAFGLFISLGGFYETAWF